MAVSREIEIDAQPEEVWDALIDEDRRAGWLEEPEREIWIEEACEPERLVWRWSDGEHPPTRVEIAIEPAGRGSRVVVIETAPSFPLPALAASFALVAA
jgi:uncharacterized protein YndB with AHSA1/START domain